MHEFLKLIFGMKLYTFRTVPLSIIRSFSLYTQQWYMLYRFADSCEQLISQTYFWNETLHVLDSSSVHHQEFFTVHIAMVYVVQWKTPDDGQRNCPKRVEFHSKNKFEKLVHLVGFIVRNLSWCMVTWPSNLSHIKVCFFCLQAFLLPRRPSLRMWHQMAVEVEQCSSWHGTAIVTSKTQSFEKRVGLLL